MSDSRICPSLDGSQTEFPSEACIAGYHFTDTDLRALDSNVAVRVLDLTESKVTDEGMRILSTLTNLERFYLTSIVRITDSGLLSVCKCISLKELCILDTSTTDDGIRYLLQLPRLECLRVGSHDMDGSGLAHLHSHPALRYLGLSINYNDESRGFAEELQAARPNLVINW